MLQGLIIANRMNLFVNFFYFKAIHTVRLCSQRNPYQLKFWALILIVLWITHFTIILYNVCNDWDMMMHENIVMVNVVVKDQWNGISDQILAFSIFSDLYRSRCSWRAIQGEFLFYYKVMFLQTIVQHI